jgi:hypothetical protein
MFKSKDKVVKRLFFGLVCILFSIFIAFSQTNSSHKNEIQNFISNFYGYQVNIRFLEEDNSKEFIMVSSINGSFTEYEHISFVISISRAFFKYGEIYNFDFDRFYKIIFKTGIFESELDKREFQIASTFSDNQQLQQEYLNSARK